MPADLIRLWDKRKLRLQDQGKTEQFLTTRSMVVREYLVQHPDSGWTFDELVKLLSSELGKRGAVAKKARKNNPDQQLLY